MPNQVLSTDISYIWTGEGWLYLAFVMDFIPDILLVGHLKTG